MYLHTQHYLMFIYYQLIYLLHIQSIIINIEHIHNQFNLYHFSTIQYISKLPSYIKYKCDEIQISIYYLTMCIGIMIIEDIVSVYLMMMLFYS